MTVFKTVLKIINKLKGMLILYTAILISITVANQTAGTTNQLEFSDSKPDIYIECKDEKVGITKGFVDYIKKHSNIIKLDKNKKDALNDAVFYRDVNYAIFIDEGFNEDIMNGKTPKINYKATGDYLSSYSEMLVEKYIKTAILYKDYYSGDELIKKVDAAVDTKIKTKLKTKLNSSKLELATRYFSFLNYAFLAGCVYCVSMVLASVKNKTVDKRTIISSFNYKKYNRIVLLANAIVMFGMWLLYMIVSLILFKDLMISANGLLFILNSFVYMFCALTIGYLIGTITQNKNAIGGIVNTVGIGTSFLCGCFVPIEYMPENVVNATKFLPTHYFVQTNEYIKTLEVFDFKNLEYIFKNCIIVILFSCIFILITNIIANKRRKIG